ncbi:MAG: flagellin [Phycisphaeraceae bacterium]
MARINTNVSSLIAQQNLARSNDDLQVRLQRLSTGVRINNSSDDPAGLIISERMRSEIGGITQAIDNAERATNVLSTAEASMSEVASLLNSIKALTIEAANDAGLSREEVEANQLQIDSAVESITRIANTTSFAGLKLLDGSLDYVTSGVAPDKIKDVRVHSANFGGDSTLPVNVEVVASAQKAGLFLSTGATTLPSAVTLEVAGEKGVDVLQFSSGTALSAVAFSINRATDSTGVRAEVVDGEAGTDDALKFESTGYGTDAFVSVQRVPGSDGGEFWETHDDVGASAAAANRDTGEDVTALINGSIAEGKGLNVSLNTNALKLDMELDETLAQTVGSPESFTLTGGGTTFQLGPQVESSQQVNFGIGSMSANRLGNSLSGYLSSIVSGGENSLTNGNAAEASRIIDDAITQVSVTRGRLGAMERNTLQTNVRSLQTSLENLSAAESRIRDADFAKETSALTRAQILTSVGTNVLTTANNSAQNVLQLLQ